MATVAIDGLYCVIDQTPQTSDWPLPQGAARVLMPQPLIADMRADALSSGCRPSAFGYYPAAVGHRMARQAPVDWLVIYCVAGAAEAWLDDMPLTVGAGDLLLLPAARAHRYAADGEAPWSIYWMHLEGSQVRDWFARLGAAAGGVVPIGLHERLVADFRALLELASSGYSHATGLHAASLSRGLLSYAVLLQQRQQHARSGFDVDALHLWMQQHLDQRLSLEELAGAAGAASRYQFIRQYKQLTGQTPMQAFVHMKVSRACYRLEVSDDSIAEVARQFGFDDPYYFSRLFKKVVGLSPAKYRAQGATRP